MATMTKPVKPPKIHQTQCFIGGQWVPAASGKTFETDQSGHRRGHCPGGRRGRGRRRSGRGGRPQGVRVGPLAQDGRPRPGPVALSSLADLIEEDADELAALEVLDNGKPISRGPRRRPAAGDRRAALLRRLCRQDSRPDDSGPRQLLHLHAARAGGRGRADHSLEFPDADGRPGNGARRWPPAARS